jgi:ribose transport system ATP-binding protein
MRESTHEGDVMLTRSSAIEVDTVRKAYGPTVALDGATYAIASGAVHALLGENGAGKSTSVKMLSGLLRPDSGVIRLFGDEVFMKSPRDAHRLGIQTAFQELTLIPGLTVAENMLLPYQPTSWTGQIRRAQAEDLVAEHLDKLGLQHIPVRAEVRSLALPQRQKVEIARAVLRKPRVLLLDEPTSALSGDDINWLGKIIADEKKRGTTIIFITHRMPEVRMFCDALTILRNGRSVMTCGIDEVSDEEVIEKIIGRSVEKTFPVRTPVNRQCTPVLEVSALSAGKVKDVTFSLAPGEILGVAGLQGMGQLDMFLALFGDLPKRSGTIKVDGCSVSITSPRDAIDARLGINLVPEERKTEALFLRLDGRRNVALPVLNKFSRYGLIDVAAEHRATAGALAKVQVAERALHMPAKAFSGGNQQKIVMAKWLLAGSRVLLLFDPTRGVDVGTKHEIYLLIDEYVKAGGAVLLYSTEIEEVVHLSHRVCVVYEGRIADQIDADHESLSEERIMRAALGGFARGDGAIRVVHGAMQ